MIDELKLLDRWDLKYRVQARARLVDNTRLTAGKDGIILIEVDDRDAAFAAVMADAYISNLGKTLSRLSTAEAAQRRGFFEKQLAKARTGMIASEAILKQSGGVTEAALKLTAGFAVATTSQIRAQITALEVKSASMRGYLSESSPEYRQVLTEISVLRQQLVKIEQDRPQTGDKNESDYLDKFRDFKYNEALFELMTRQLDGAIMDESREGNVMQVVDRAEVPERRASPKVLILSLIALVLSFALSAGFTYVNFLRKLSADSFIISWLFELRRGLRSSKPQV
jgi:capsule polysaccharide export protein KpsE/RkpR